VDDRKAPHAVLERLGRQIYSSFAKRQFDA
jgi:origin recognition complex subunit 4